MDGVQSLQDANYRFSASAPVAWQRAPRLLIELMGWARKALAVSLLSSLHQRLTRRMRFRVCSYLSAY